MVTQLFRREAFRHETLDNIQSSIRLINLLPTLSAEGLIQCEIFHGTTDTSYRCLSYRWGDPLPEFPIMINGARFSVRKQLYEFLALQRSRMSPGTRSDEPLWIDALCIDQTNNSERSHQVAQMGEIFGKASQVLIWLGSTPMLTSLCAAHRRRFNRFVSSMTPEEKIACSRLCNESGEISPLLAYVWLARQDITYPIFYGPDSSDTHRSMLQPIEEEIIRNRYWSRAWITQEVCLAQRAFLVLETEEDLPFEKLLDVMEHSVWLRSGLAFWELSRSLADSRIKSFGGRRYLSERLMPLLYRFRDKDCAIPRDRIFSVLPLYRWGHLIEVDYDNTDDRLVVEVLSSLREPVRVCSVASFVHTLRPRSGPLGLGYIEIELRLSTFYWGPLQMFKTHLPRPSTSCREGEKAPAIYARSLDRVGNDDGLSRDRYIDHKPQLGPSGFDCQVWLSMRQFCLKQITLVGLPTYCSWDDACIPGEKIEFSDTAVQHDAKDHPKALPRPSSSKKWRLYTEGVTLREQKGQRNVWTFRISLATIWAYMEEVDWKRPQPCSHICRDVRLGYSD